jgi:hypothetical protein
MALKRLGVIIKRTDRRSMANENRVELVYEVPINADTKARYELLNKRKLQVELENSVSKKTYTIDLLALNPQSIERKVGPRSANRLKRATIPAVAALALALLVAFYADAHISIVGSVAIALLIVAAIYLQTKQPSVSEQRKQRVFVSRAAKVPLVEIGFTKRSRNLERFVKILEKRVSEALRASELEEKELLAGELRALRRLVEKGALSKQAYEKAKKHLLSLAN